MQVLVKFAFELRFRILYDLFLARPCLSTAASLRSALCSHRSKPRSAPTVPVLPFVLAVMLHIWTAACEDHVRTLSPSLAGEKGLLEVQF